MFIDLNEHFDFNFISCRVLLVTSRPRLHSHAWRLRKRDRCEMKQWNRDKYMWIYIVYMCMCTACNGPSRTRRGPSRSASSLFQSLSSLSSRQTRGNRVSEVPWGPLIGRSWVQLALSGCKKVFKKTKIPRNVQIILCVAVFFFFFVQ